MIKLMQSVTTLLLNKVSMFLFNTYLPTSTNVYSYLDPTYLYLVNPILEPMWLVNWYNCTTLK